eukprot:TRINITY_DN3882_c0_g1_i6.p1 TRINITY_DN3882_c0_g1~~TRINITY_DN3882_c0_g1_i6.p1  ORF type:complete len:357 (-),score=92.76 TRINITY_DN3882_c0_g1_i6:90-1160(-)
MGNCMGGLTPEEQRELKEKQKLNKQINNAAAEKYGQEEQVAKLLLLGVGESGKSTLFRQMQLLHGEGFKPAMRVTYKAAIHGQIIEDVQALLKENPEHKEEEFRLSSTSLANVDKLLALNKAEPLTAEAGEMIKKLWSDPAFQLTFEHRKSVQVADSTSYFLDRISVVCRPDYYPEDEDLIRMRLRTTGLVKEFFTIDKLKFQLCDVGGQRNERKKWMHMFDGVTAVLFVTAISEYDQFCFEDEMTLRTIESLEVFEQIFTQNFISTPIILFLNKKDLFDKKFHKVPLKNFFPDFTGETLEEGYDFFKEKYIARLPCKRDVYSHVTTATDPDDCKRVFQAVQHIIVKIQLGDSSFL